MPKFSKTVYVEVDAPDEDDAEAEVTRAMAAVVMDNENAVWYVDVDGPIEEVTE
jgi:hypothetical protein